MVRQQQRQFTEQDARRQYRLIARQRLVDDGNIEISAITVVIRFRIGLVMRTATGRPVMMGIHMRGIDQLDTLTRQADVPTAGAERAQHSQQQ